MHSQAMDIVLNIFYALVGAAAIIAYAMLMFNVGAKHGREKERSRCRAITLMVGNACTLNSQRRIALECDDIINSDFEFLPKVERPQAWPPPPEPIDGGPSAA